MKLWEKIFIGIGIILSIFIIMTIRKFVIFTNLNYLNKEKQSIDNIYSKVTINQETIETFIKGNAEKIILKRNGETITQLTKPEYRILYKDNGVNKTRSVYNDDYNKHMNMAENQNKIANFVDYITLPEKIWSSICSSVKTETINGQAYYVISGHNTNIVYYENTKNVKVYINKDTGLTYKRVEEINENGNIREEVAMYEYKFNTVTDNDMAELNNEEYELEK